MFDLNNAGLSSFKRQPKKNWNSEKAIVTINDTHICLSHKASELLQLEDSSLITVLKQDDKVYLANVSTKTVNPANTFKVSQVRQDIKGARTGRNKNLLATMLNPMRYALISGLRYELKVVDFDEYPVCLLTEYVESTTLEPTLTEESTTENNSNTESTNTLNTTTNGI